MATATQLIGRQGMQVAQIGPRDYVVTAWDEDGVRALAGLEAVLDDLVRREPSALVVDVRAVALLDAAIVDTLAAAMRRLSDVGVRGVLVVDWRELANVAGAEGLDRFAAVRPTLASAIDAAQGRPA